MAQDVSSPDLIHKLHLEQRNRSFQEVEILVDPHKTLRLEDVLTPHYQSQFKRRSLPDFQVPYDKAAWLKLHITHSYEEPILWMIAVGMIMIERVDFYTNPLSNIDAPPEEWIHQQSGALRPISIRERKHPTPSFLINLEPNQVQTIYFRLENNYPNHVWVFYADFQESLSGTLFIMLVYGAYFGMMAIFMLYNITLSVGLKDITFFYYSLYIGTVMALLFHNSGFAYFYFWPEAPLWNPIATDALTALTQMTALFFSIQFLNTQRYLPRLHKFLLGLMAVPPLLLVATRLDSVWSFWSAGLILLFYPIVMVAGWKCYRLGHRPAKFFLLAWSCWIIGIVWLLLAQFGVLSYSENMAVMVIVGTTMEILLFSLALADVINTSRLQKEAAQTELIAQQQQALSQQKRMTDSFIRFVPQEFLSLLKKDDFVEVQLGDAVQEHMTVLFLDIRSFTSTSEGMTPQENFEYLNAYFYRVGPIIREHSGFIDKFIGDAVMALFPGKPHFAVDAAISLYRDLQIYNETLLAAGKAEIRIGIGINTGSLMLGVIGEQKRIESTVISDAVNLASRIESVTKEYHCPILISEYTFYALGNPQNYSVRLIDKVQMKGKQQAVTIFEIFDGDDPIKQSMKLETVKPFETGVTCYFRQEFESALRAFHQCLEQDPDDPTVHFYVRRCQQYLP